MKVLTYVLSAWDGKKLRKRGKINKKISRKIGNLILIHMEM
jgi:hypothetical protein